MLFVAFFLSITATAYLGPLFPGILAENIGCKVITVASAFITFHVRFSILRQIAHRNVNSSLGFNDYAIYPALWNGGSGNHYRLHNSSCSKLPNSNSRK